MKSIKKKFKKGTAMLLACTMMAGLLTVMPQSAIRVKAAGTAPGVSAYATKEQLMDGTFAPDSSGIPVNIGKLVFGNIEWYILGKDSEVSGGTDNTVIFAAIPIMRMAFEDKWENKTFVSNFGVYASNPSEVYPNHYGASDLRVTLDNMVNGVNTTYFTLTEQGLMNATTVTTYDTLNKVNYTTTDKLYALTTDGGVGSRIIKAGSNNQKTLARDSYWKIGTGFWLRSPDTDWRNALFAAPGYGARKDSVGISMTAVRPASNLNLSSVIFASAATAASSGTATSGTIDKDATGAPKAMTLRLDGSGKNIGTVTYNTTTGDIKAAKGSTTGAVALVVQGNDGTKDWYYSKQIAGIEAVNASAIKSTLNL
ncbi:MAG: hypothetical protein ACI4DR_03030, partial [Roseburia sp.]